MEYTVDLPKLKYLIKKLTEALTLRDLGAGVVSGITSRSLSMRTSNPEAKSGIDVIQADWSKSEDSLTIYFEVDPTFLDRYTTVMTPGASEYTGTFYNVIFKFSSVGKYLGDQDSFETNKQQSLLAQALLNCEVKLHSNAPDFYYQGGWEDLASVGAAVFSFPGPHGDGTWRNRHAASGGLKNPKIRLTKHQAQIVSEIASFVPQILNKLKFSS